MSSRAPRSQSPARSGRKPRHGNTAVGKKRFSDDPRAGRPRRPRSDAAGYPRTRSEERPPRAEQRGEGSRPSRPSRPRPERSERTDRGERFERRHESGGRRRPEHSNSRPERRNSRAPEVLPERFRGTVVEATAHIDQSFASLGVGKSICQALAESGAHSPFAIQAATIPAGLQGRDLLVRSHTGSGKTIAFGVTLVEAVLRAGSGKRREFGRAPKGLIVAPTRELALQIDRVVQPLARAVGLFTTQVYGGVPQGKQVGALRRGVDIVIGTPGRLEDLIEQGHLDLSSVIVATIDEADHMAELGFIEPVRRLLELTDPEGQRLLFSATLDKQVASLVDQFLTDPAIFELHDSRDDHTSVEHRVMMINPRERMETVAELARDAGKVLVFSRTRRGAEEMRDFLDDNDIRAVDLHGDLNQNRRQRNLQQLTSGRVNVLVATDVAARGIHVDDIDLVIQADLPDDSKTYVHRAGRTGRAGKPGVVVTLATNKSSYRLGGILRDAGVQAEEVASTR
jgi:superfamily II DNA/RNA helicase